MHLSIFPYRNHNSLILRLKQCDVFGKQKPPPHRDGGPLFHSVGRSRAKCFYRKHITEKDTGENADSNQYSLISPFQLPNAFPYESPG